MKGSRHKVVGALFVVWIAIGASGCARQLQRIEVGVDQVAREQVAQRRALAAMQQALEDLTARDDEREQQVAERRAELEAQLLALDRAVRRMDARAEEQEDLLQQIRAALDLIARQQISMNSVAEVSPTESAPSASSSDDAEAGEEADEEVETPIPSSTSNSPGTDVYEGAFADYTRGSYTLARQGFQELLQRFPDSELADDAAYWIAETHYAQGDPTTALAQFQSILEEYPRGDSITPALLKIGYCYLELGQEDAARDAFRRLIREFGESDEALIAQHKLSTLGGASDS